MTEDFVVFVNEERVTARAGMTVVAVVAQHAPELTAAFAGGTAYATDGVGRSIDPATPVHPGEIIRLVPSARRSS